MSPKEVSCQLYMCVCVCVCVCLCVYNAVSNCLLFVTAGTTESRNSCFGSSIQITEIGGR